MSDEAMKKNKPTSKKRTHLRRGAVASDGRIETFLAKYAALVRSTGIYVDRAGGLAMPIPSDSNQMETPEEHIARLYREERLSPFNHGDAPTSFKSERR